MDVSKSLTSLTCLDSSKTSAYTIVVNPRMCQIVASRRQIWHEVCAMTMTVKNQSLSAVYVTQNHHMYGSLPILTPG